jgi:glycosyltransferase involved in cell wall biosynthesis
MSDTVALFVWGAVQLGGAERRFFRLFNHLASKGLDIRLMTSPQGAAACRALGISLEGRKVHVLGDGSDSGPRIARHFAALGTMLSVLGIVRREGIRHLHFGQNPGALTFLFALLAGFGCRFSVSLVDSIKAYQRNRRERLYARVTVRRAARVDCLSEQIRADLAEFMGGEETGKYLVAPCSFTEPRNVDPAVVRDVDVVLISRMVPQKGHMLLRDALAELSRAGRTGLRVHVCGSGPLEAQLRREFGALVDQDVQVYYQEDAFALLSRSRVCVSLQDVENYPSQSLLEAMSCECAIVATDVGLTRLLLDESCAILIPAKPAALAHAIRILLDDEPRCRQYGRNARRVVLTRQTIDRFATYLANDLLGVRGPLPEESGG